MQNVVEIKKRTKSAVLADTLVFVSVLAILITTLLSVVSTVTMFGGKITYGESMNIIEFFVGEEGFISYFANMLDGLESGSEEAILEVFGVFRVLVVLVSVILQLIFALINGIAIIVRFSKKDSIKVAKTGLSALSATMRHFLLLSLFATLSGGIDDSAFAVGYTGGLPLAVALIALFISLMVAGILKYKDNKGKVDSTVDSGKRFIGAILCALCAVAIKVVLNFTYVYSIITGTAYSYVTVFAGILQGGVDLLGLLYPVLNIFIIVAFFIVMKKSSNNMQSSLRYLLEYGEQVELKNKKPKAYAIKGYVLTIVCSLVAIASVYALRIPSVGSGWEANVFVQLVAIFIISCLGQTFVSVFVGKKAKTATDIPTALPKDLAKVEQQSKPIIQQPQITYDGQSKVVYVEPVYQPPVQPAPTPVEQPIVQPMEEQPESWFCPMCGKQNSGNFCGRCGTKKPE